MAHRALVIDDDKATLDLMEFQLKAEGFRVTTAENGQQGLKFIEDDEFDIILTDLQLPGLSGIEIVKRSKELSPETEIIMVTGYGSTEKAIEATKAGAFYYIEKPVEFDDLIILDRQGNRAQTAKGGNPRTARETFQTQRLRRHYRRKPFDAGHLRID